MKFVLVFLTIQYTWCQHILAIGDSHMAGPFGQQLHKLLSENYQTVMTLGHASSAAIHWNQGTTKLSGGVFHKFYFQNKQYPNPKPSHWRESVLVPKASDLLTKHSPHSRWPSFQDYDTVIIELGANDLQIISNSDATIRRIGFSSRLQENITLLNTFKGLKCLWIGPPLGKNKSTARTAVVYQMLEEMLASASQNTCKLFDSRHFYADACDGVHFNCPALYSKASKWAEEVFHKLSNITIEAR